MHSDGTCTATSQSRKPGPIFIPGPEGDMDRPRTSVHNPCHIPLGDNDVGHRHNVPPWAMDSSPPLDLPESLGLTVFFGSDGDYLRGLAGLG